MNMNNDDYAAQLKAQATAKFEMDAARKTLSEKIDKMLYASINNGWFKATPELMTFLAMLDEETVVITDLYNRPIMIDRAAALSTFKQLYKTVMNEWHNEYHKLSKIRKVSDV